MMLTDGRLYGAAMILALGALAGCGNGEAAAGGAAAAPGGGPGGPPGGGRGGARTSVVETAAVMQGSIAQEVALSGVVEPLRTVGVNSQLAGAVTQVFAEEGTRVRAGQVLVRMDDRELAAQVRSLQASFAVAESNYQRAEQLRERQVVTQAEYDRDRAAYEAARAQLDGLRTRLSYATVRAPVDGVVTRKAVEQGDVVGAQARLFEIGELATLVVRVNVSERDVVSLRAGQPADIGLDAFPGQSYTGTIRRIFPAADPASRLVPVEVALTGEAMRVARPGFLARVALALGTRDDVLLVPGSAVVGDAGAQSVFVVEDGKASRRPVRTGLTSRGQVEIVGGVAAGEVVVTVGNNSLRDGADVRVVNGPGAAPQRAVDSTGERSQGTASAGGRS
jgi:membrane fusion protein, multidrug efflux system